MTETPDTQQLPSTPAPPTRRPEPGTPPEAANEYSPDGWEANQAVLARLAEHRVSRQP
ncbi:hypothetical protein [Streptomyces guryensis]|uniref:Uncharacterized protein n=1 Tax=Streptomyces guryensis TaxID=2886947 RepID=A0A9Q3Z7C6_9ACTN|nr:hypothetical protein [Streptomyces guryensis]MCD9872145.1 hypothetical protein [Streptomyces guryensis]